MEVAIIRLFMCFAKQLDAMEQLLTYQRVMFFAQLLLQVGLSGGLLFVVHAMYQCLVNYTGAVPAEFYSIKKRPVGWMVG